MFGVTIFHPDLTVKMPPNSHRTAANATPALTALALLAVISCFCNKSVVGKAATAASLYHSDWLTH